MIPVPSSLPCSQLAARQDCRWATVFCRALADSPIGLLKHLVSLSQRHYELININSLFWYLLLPGALAWAFFFTPHPQTATARSRLRLAEGQRGATRLGDRGVPSPVPITHWGRGCCQAPASLLARLGLSPGGPPCCQVCHPSPPLPCRATGQVMAGCSTGVASPL